jgi:hypothetical protein
MVMEWHEYMVGSLSLVVSCPVSTRNGGCPVPVPLEACSSLAVWIERAIAACTSLSSAKA